jgi:hypothetical protein
MRPLHAADPRAASFYAAGMLHDLPFTTFSEIAALGLEAHVYCPTCHTMRQLDPMADRLRDRCFAGTRFRCTNTRCTSETCGAVRAR